MANRWFVQSLLFAWLVSCSDDAPTRRAPILFLADGPIYSAPSDPLAGSAVESCAVLGEQRCVDGDEQQCAIYDTGAADFPQAPDPLLERIYLFDRWYDLYHSPDGQTGDRRFTESVAHDALESHWGDPAHFAEWDGLGDSALWSGMALNEHMIRYLVTGTEADYQRFEDKARALLRKFDVTEIPGYVARFYGVAMPAGTLPNDQHTMPPFITDDVATWEHRFNVINDPIGKGLPAIYGDGTGVPFWKGQPSIDSYSGLTTPLAAAWGLLRDAQLKAKITTGLTCYLKRLRRLEIINMQESGDAQQLVQNLFGGGQLALDAGDYDFAEAETLVVYYLEQPNSKNVDTFDSSCPATVARQPKRVIDALGGDAFLLEMLAFAADLGADEQELANGIDHSYLVNLSGADAMHLMNLTAIAYYLTGDAEYLDFFETELVGNLRAPEVAGTLGALQQPKWCRSYYGDHRTLNPLWAFINLLAPSALKETMREVMHTEGWEKTAQSMRNPKLSLLYAATAPDGHDDTVGRAIAEAVEVVETMGGNGGALNAPRRNYSMAPQEVIDRLPDGTEAVCPTEEERGQCEDGFEIFGIHVDGERITKACTGDPTECALGSVCAQPMASYGLPVDLRVHSDYIWQRNPYEIGSVWADSGVEQSPGMDVAEPYWLARFYGAIGPVPAVLAWQSVGSCP